MELTTDVKKIELKTERKFCPYRGEMDWQIECIKERCMKYDPIKGLCMRA